MFVPLSRLQQYLSVLERVNTLLVSGRDATTDATGIIEQAIRKGAQLEDVGLNTTTVTGPSSALSIGADSGLLDEARAAAVAKALEGTGLSAQPMFTYLANSLRVGDREVPDLARDGSERSKRLERPFERSDRDRSDRLGCERAARETGRLRDDGVLTCLKTARSSPARRRCASPVSSR